MILLVDDQPEMGSLVRLSLGDPDTRVLQVGNLHDAIAAIDREVPKLVLLDVDLRVEDGLDILPQLRAQPGMSNVPILAFTVHDSRRQEAIDLGAQGLVAKPFKTDELRRIVEAHVHDGG